MNIQRRSLLFGLGAALVAGPAVIRTPGLLMDVKSFVVIDPLSKLYDDWLEEFGRQVLDAYEQGFIGAAEEVMAELHSTGSFSRGYRSELASLV